MGGNVKLHYDQSISFHKGPVFWLSYPGPLIEHEPVEPGSGWIHRYLAFCGPLAQYWWQSGLLPKKPMEPENNAPWTGLFDELLQFPLTTRKTWDHEVKINRLENLLLMLMRFHEPERESGWLSKAKRLLGDTRQFHPDIVGTARAVNMGVSTFRRKFKEATGGSPQN